MKFGAEAITDDIVIVVGFLLLEGGLREGLCEGCVGRHALSCFLVPLSSLRPMSETASRYDRGYFVRRPENIT